MALFSIKKINQLETGYILAPDRYNPTRNALQSKSSKNTTLLGDLCDFIKATVSPNSGIGPCLVLDTSNAFEGIITNYSKPVPNSQLGSNKRIVNIGDVIVSRLRPYLRQVAFVDEDIPFFDRSVSIVTSTEFFCLRRKQQQSIAFLVPLLLSDQVQQILGAAQEGGHHPRFNSDVLLNIPVPNEFLVQRDSVSQRIEESIRLVRESEKLRLHLRNLSEELLTAA